MFWLLASVALLFLLLAYLLFAPLTLQISTERSLLRLSVHKIAQARLAVNDNTLLVIVRAPGWNKSFDLLAPPKESPGKKSKKTTGNRKSPPLRKILAVARSFRCSGYADIDTGSMPMNGILYPFFLWLRRRGIPVAINFRDELSIELEIKNTAARMLWAYVSS